MEPIKNIQKRIRQRQYSGINETTPQLKEKVIDKDDTKHGFRQFIYKFTTRLLIVTSLLLGFLIYAKNDENATFIKEKLGYQLDLSYVNQIGNGLVSRLLDFDIFNSFIPNNDQLVSEAPEYLLIGGNKFTNDDGKTYSMGSGKVAYVGDGLAGQHMIIVKTVDNIVITYVGVEETFVFVEDWVDNNDIIASFNDELTMYFTKEGASLSYEEVVQIIEQD